MTNILRMTGFFGLLLITVTSINIYFYDSENKERLGLYSEEKIRLACPKSPQEEFYQECFRKDLSKVLSNFSPLDAYTLINRIKALDILESHHLKRDEDKVRAFILKYENLILFVENSSNLTINRNKFNFYSFPLIPVAQLYVKHYFKNQVEEFNNSKFKSLSLPEEDPMTFRLKRVQKRIPLIQY